MTTSRCFWIVYFLCLSFLIKAEDKEDLLVFGGQANAWLTTQFKFPPVLQPGFRFVPVITGKYLMKNKHTLDYEISANLNGSLTFANNSVIDSTFQFKPYRIWFRNSTDKYEFRVGLQKINFGSARMFRPLMWFDAMDVRDPLQLTDGVKAALFKYFFENNANVWLWGMMTNQKPKGFESFGSQAYIPEVGGMFEFPLGPGEMGIATHFRKLNLSENNFGNAMFPNVSDNLLSIESIAESRLGMHGKWDLGVGLWFETSISRYSENIYIPRWTDMLNVGVDYTFGLGNGLGTTFEYFRYHNGNQFFTNDMKLEVLGAMCNYPLSLNDQLSAMMFYLPEKNKIFNYISWNKTLDNIDFHCIAYWNPEDATLLNVQSSSRNLYSGKGLQIMLSYHF